jgi:hypothetical protein
MRQGSQVILRSIVGFAIVSAVIGTASRPAAAQQYPPLIGPIVPPPNTQPVLGATPPPPPSPLNTVSNLQVTITPLLALANINTSINTPLEHAPVVDTHVGVGQLLSHLDGVPLMGTVELRDGPFSLLGAVLHVPVGADITTRNIFFNGGNASLTTNIGTAALLYHVLDEPQQSIDAGIGFRAWGVSSELTLNGGILPTTTINRTADIDDPLIVARYHHDFGNGFGLTAYGDVGGFGVSAHADWQLLGTIDYTLKSWVALRVGYVSLNVSAGGGALGYIVHINGPILAAAFRF